MSQHSVISDPFKFASERRSMAGSTPVAALNRLEDLLADNGGELAWRVDGESAQDGGPLLRVSVTGELQLRCQRCLEALKWLVKIESTLKLVRQGSDIPDDELEIDEYDAIEAPDNMSVPGLIEEELLLAMPVAPRHENCDALSPAGGNGKESSFAALAKLQKRGRTT